MEKLIKIDNPFHERIVKAYGLVSISHFDLIVKPSNFSNGFTIYESKLFIEKPGWHGTIVKPIYFIRPNRSPRWFCFAQLLHAISFCAAHTNKHSNSYWFKQFISVYSYESACTLIMSTLNKYHFSPINDDDLPF